MRQTRGRPCRRRLSLMTVFFFCVPLVLPAYIVIGLLIGSLLPTTAEQVAAFAGVAIAPEVVRSQPPRREVVHGPVIDALTRQLSLGSSRADVERFLQQRNKACVDKSNEFICRFAHGSGSCGDSAEIHFKLNADKRLARVWIDLDWACL